MNLQKVSLEVKTNNIRLVEVMHAEIGKYPSFLTFVSAFVNLAYKMYGVTAQEALKKLAQNYDKQ